MQMSEGGGPGPRVDESLDQSQQNGASGQQAEKKTPAQPQQGGGPGPRSPSDNADD